MNPNQVGLIIPTGPVYDRPSAPPPRPNPLAYRKTPVYVPPPTDAMEFSMGFTPQPANPYFFSTWQDALDILADLRANLTELPIQAVVRDAPEAYGAPLRYGQDGRRVYVVEFTAIDKDGVPTFCSTSVGQMIWAKNTYPNHQWKLDFGGSCIVRNPTTPEVR